MDRQLMLISISQKIKPILSMRAGEGMASVGVGREGTVANLVRGWIRGGGGELCSG